MGWGLGFRAQGVGSRLRDYGLAYRPCRVFGSGFRV